MFIAPAFHHEREVEWSRTLIRLTTGGVDELSDIEPNTTMGLAHFGQAGAASLTSVPQSGHLISAIVFPLEAAK